MCVTCVWAMWYILPQASIRWTLSHTVSHAVEGPASHSAQQQTRSDDANQPRSHPYNAWRFNFTIYYACLHLAHHDVFLPLFSAAAFKISKGSSVDSLSSTAPTTPSTFLYSYCCKSAGAAVAATLAIWPALPVLANHWFYALCLSLSLGAIWDFWCLVVALWFGVEVAPSFDKPWLSTSFADYWSRRWNLTTTYMLR